MNREPHILVLGAGSIGRRHARNLAAAGARVALTDPAAPDGPSAADPEGITRVPWGARDHEHYPGVVVASPTVHHLTQTDAAARAGSRVLVEKPLAMTMPLGESLRSLNEQVRVGFNLRFHDPVRQLVDLVHAGRVGRVLAARLWFGYHLPSWRPGTDYRHSYSARADLGGGILLDAIHELDMAVWLLGPDLTVDTARIARVGDLEVDVEDTVRAVLRTVDGAPVDIALDYLSRDYRRGIEVVGSEATIRLDWARQVLEVDDGQKVSTTPAEVSVDRSYESEAEAFLAWVDGVDRLPVDVDTALVSLRLADEIRERSA